MGAQNGKDLLVKVDMTGTGQFETVAGLRATRLSFNAESVDVTSVSSQQGWRELLGGAGVKSASISGSGVFRDAATDERARAIFFNGETPEFQIIIPDFGVVEGPFLITGLDYAGSHNGEATFELSLASAGMLEFLPDMSAEFAPGDPADPEDPGDPSDPVEPPHPDDEGAP